MSASSSATTTRRPAGTSAAGAGSVSLMVSAGWLMSGSFVPGPVAPRSVRSSRVVAPPPGGAALRSPRDGRPARPGSVDASPGDRFGQAVSIQDSTWRSRDHGR
ncbi:hypothetical protein Acsp06_04690 [Actinomycetospora sp. NBRC 106375]|nr:hypothetical protein Acsp06_04690 [Actinomycetospora sp. NBRC 106375]